MKDENNIVMMPGTSLPDCPVQVQHDVGNYCLHEAIRLVDHDRSVLCAKCGATLDPYNYLRREAVAIRRGWDAHRELQRKSEQLHGKIAELEKEAKRLGARVKRLQEKEPPPMDLRKPL